MFLFCGGANGLSASPTWTITGEHAGDDFGAAVAGIGDVNGDGFTDIAVGAASYGGRLPKAGKVYVFYGSSLGLHRRPDWAFEGEKGIWVFRRVLRRRW